MSNEIQKLNQTLQKQQKLGSSLSSKILKNLENAVAELDEYELPRMFNQLVIFVLDGSGSMTFNGDSGRSKGQEVHQAVIGVKERLIQSKNKLSFDCAAIAFARDTNIMYGVKNIKEFNLQRDVFNPCEFIVDKGATFIGKALEEAGSIALSYIEKYKEQNTKVLICILGDGAIHDYDEALTYISNKLVNDQIIIASLLFETPEWIKSISETELKQTRNDFNKLASPGYYYPSTIDVETIRAHMIQSITKVSQTQI
jgi:hypothetical protein